MILPDPLTNCCQGRMMSATRATMHNEADKTVS